MAGDYLGIRQALAKLLVAALRKVEEASPETRERRSAWLQAANAYQCALQDYETHVAMNYHSALTAFETELASMTAGISKAAAIKVRSMLFLKHRIQEIEEHGDVLARKWHEELYQLIATDSPSLTELALKLALIRDKLVLEEPFSGAIIDVARDAMTMTLRGPL